MVLAAAVPALDAAAASNAPIAGAAPASGSRHARVRAAAQHTIRILLIVSTALARCALLLWGSAFVATCKP
jgi:hypothetical protein